MSLVSICVFPVQIVLTASGSYLKSAAAFDVEYLSGVAHLRWIAISHTNDSESIFQSEERAIACLRADQTFLERMLDALLHPDSRSGKDFVIMS
jgi:hypothetical protein